MSNITNENKIIAKTAASIFGGQPKVEEYWDENENSSVDLLTCKGAPQKSRNSYSTIGLSDFPLMSDENDLGIGIELLGACESSCDEFSNIMTTASFYIINSQWLCTPGTIFPNIVSMYGCSSTMQHLLFVPPSLWSEEFKTIEFETKTVAWLMVIPISEADYSFADMEGSDKLEDLFVEKKIDIFNIERPSVV